MIKGITVLLIKGIIVLLIKSITVLLIKGITVLLIKGITVLLIKGITVLLIKSITVLLFLFVIHVDDEMDEKDKNKVAILNGDDFFLKEVHDISCIKMITC